MLHLAAAVQLQASYRLVAPMATTFRMASPRRRMPSSMASSCRPPNVARRKGHGFSPDCEETARGGTRGRSQHAVVWARCAGPRKRALLVSRLQHTLGGQGKTPRRGGTSACASMQKMCGSTRALQLRGDHMCGGKREGGLQERWMDLSRGLVVRRPRAAGIAALQA